MTDSEYLKNHLHVLKRVNSNDDDDFQEISDEYKTKIKSYIQRHRKRKKGNKILSSKKSNQTDDTTNDLIKRVQKKSKNSLLRKNSSVSQVGKSTIKNIITSTKELMKTSPCPFSSQLSSSQLSQLSLSQSSSSQPSSSQPSSSPLSSKRSKPAFSQEGSNIDDFNIEKPILPSRRLHKNQK
ncbi:unnamed protein product [Cunninghamella blakesleeana]